MLFHIKKNLDLLILLLVFLSSIFFYYSIIEYSQTIGIYDDKDLEKFISENIKTNFSKIIEKKNIDDKVFILYEFSKPKRNVDVIALQKSALFKRRYRLFPTSYRSKEGSIKNYKKRGYFFNDEKIFIYCGLNPNDVSYYLIFYNGFEKKIKISNEYTFDVYINDDKLDYNNYEKIYDKNNKVIEVLK